jgi:hypothetical protein
MNIKNKKTPDQLLEGARNSICFVNMILKNGLSVDVQGVCVDNPSNFVSCCGDLYKDVKKLEIRFPWSHKVFKPLEVKHYYETGIFVLRLPRFDSVQPLHTGRPERLKANDKLYMPMGALNGWVSELLKGRIIQLELGGNNLMIDHDLSWSEMGSPMLDCCGDLIGIASSPNEVTNKVKEEQKLIKELYQEKAIDHSSYVKLRERYKRYFARIISVTAFPAPFRS